MDHNSQLLRRAHSPSVAAAAAAATTTTTVVESHSHNQHHPHNHGQTQSHLNPPAGQGLRPMGMGSPALHINSGIHGGSGLVQIKKPLTTAHGSASSMTTSLSPNQSYGHGLPHQTQHHESQHQHQHQHNHDHGHGHDHSHDHGHDHSYDHNHDHNHGHNHNHNHNHNHTHSHDHSHDHSARISGASGFYGGTPAPDHKHEPRQFFESQQFQHQQSFHPTHHDHHGHSHHGHDHSHDHAHGHGHEHGHGHYDHGHGHDHSHGHGHDHSHGHAQSHLDHHHDHAHSHGHDHHGHNHDHHHHGHNHDHHHHGHDHDHHHHHQYPVSFRSQLPSYGQIFGGLMPNQKTMFTWVLLHSVIAFMTWLSGMGDGSLAVVGLGYMMLFDAFGVLNTFISSVIHTDMRMKRATVKHPFGIQRFEILFGLSNAIFLLFIGMNMLKESLEHLMLEDDHHGGNDRGGHQAAVRISVFWPLIGLGATLISALGYRNHSQFCQLLEPRSRAAFGRSNASILTGNRFTLTSLGCVVGVALVAMFPHVEGMDKLVAIVQSIVMFTLGGPLTKTLGMIILQTTPPGALESVEEAIRQLSAANPAILRIDRAHVWTNTYGQLIGTLILSVAKGSDEQALLAIIHQRLQTFLDLDAKAEGTGELTVKLVQH